MVILGKNQCRIIIYGVVSYQGEPPLFKVLIVLPNKVQHLFPFQMKVIFAGDSNQIIGYKFRSQNACFQSKSDYKFQAIEGKRLKFLFLLYFR